MGKTCNNSFLVLVDEANTAAHRNETSLTKRRANAGCQRPTDTPGLMMVGVKFVFAPASTNQKGTAQLLSPRELRTQNTTPKEAMFAFSICRSDGLPLGKIGRQVLLFLSQFTSARPALQHRQKRPFFLLFRTNSVLRGKDQINLHGRIPQHTTARRSS